jgi:hypothetical protein
MRPLNTYNAEVASPGFYDRGWDDSVVWWTIPPSLRDPSWKTTEFRNARLYGLNDHGWVVGSEARSAETPVDNRSCILGIICWAAGRTYTPSTDTQAMYLDADGHRHWIEPLLPGTRNEARDINNTNDIVGWSADPSAPTSRVAFARFAPPAPSGCTANVPCQLRTAYASYATIAVRVSDRNAWGSAMPITVGSTCSSLPLFDDLFGDSTAGSCWPTLWASSSSGGYQGWTVAVPSMRDGVALGVNGAGNRIVGWYKKWGDLGRTRAFIWHMGQAYDLEEWTRRVQNGQTVVARASDYELLEAHAVSEAGLVAVGRRVGTTRKLVLLLRF